MKIKMYVYGGDYLIPTKYKPSCGSFNNFVFIDCDIKQQIEICKSHSIRRRWNKIDIETPNNFQVAEKDYFSISDLYSPGVLETFLNYYSTQSKSKSKIKLVSDWQWKYCFVSNVEVVHAI